MAISDNFNTTNQYIKYRIEVVENSVDVANNTSNITVSVQVWRTNQGYETYGRGTCYVTIAGQTYSEAIDRDKVFSYNSYTQVFSTTLDVEHDDDGSKDIYVSSYITHTQFTSEEQGFTVALTTIARYAEITQTLASKTETTISVNWTTDATVDYLWYSVDDGANWTGVDIADGTSGAYTVSGLTASSIYDVKTRVRRKDSQLSSDSEALNVTTYDYPYANSMPDFTIGNRLVIGLYNPLGRTVSIYMVGNDNSEHGGDQISGTSVDGFNTSEWTAWEYSTIPNSQSGTYKIKVVYGDIVRVNTGGTYTVNTADCAPIIGGAGYKDTNANTIAITGNDQKIVRNLSAVLYTANGLAGQKSASIVSCSVSVNENSYTLALSGSTATGGNEVIDSASDVSAVFTVTDTRGLTSTITVYVTVLDWTLPTAIISLQRKNNFYSETYITVDADFSYIDGQNVGVITYKAKKVGDTAYTISGTLQDNVQATFIADNNYEWDVVVTLTDIFNATATYNLYLSRGLPIIYFDRIKSSVGVNCFPQKNNSFEVNGLTIVDLIYPVGSLYMSTSAAKPSTLFGGTWERIKDAFLLASGDTYSAGSTGGEAAHTLTISELPEHQHDLQNTDSSGEYADFTSFGVAEASNQGEAGNIRTSYVGGGQAHNNMPPYLCVNIWKRTA